MCYEQKPFQRRADDKDRARKAADAAIEKTRQPRPVNAPAPSEQRMPATMPLAESDSD